MEDIPMPKYYVNNTRQTTNGRNHEVHKEGCYWLGKIASAHPLGDYTSCQPAVSKAKQIYADADGCKSCSPLCHTA